MKTGGKKSVKAMVLCGGAAPASLVGVSTDANGQPIKRFKKDLIHVGEFVVPHDDLKFSVDREWIDGRVEQFAKMKAAGVKVPVPEGHNTDPSKNRGYVLGMFRDGDDLVAEIELVGEDAIKLASRNEVSIYVPPTFKDGSGNEYEQPITHVALTPVPVIPGQKPFIPIAASREPVAVYRLEQGAPAMEKWHAIAKKLGISPDGMDEQALFDAIMAKLGTNQTETTTMLSRTRQLESDLKLAREAVKTKAEPTAIELKLSRQNRELVLSQLVEKGHITEAVRKHLHGVWVGEDGAALKLSLDPESDSRFDAMVEALRLNDPVKIAERTGIQTLTLARPGDPKGSDVDPDLEARAKNAYGKP